MTQPNAALSYHIGDVVTLMDSTTGKNLLRPALVLADTGDDDIVIARITTHQTRDSSDVNIRNWSMAGLDRQSVARPHKLATIAKRLVGQKVGSLSLVDLQEVRTSFGLLGI
jgi:mRNA interferase MazF